MKYLLKLGGLLLASLVATQAFAQTAPQIDPGRRAGAPTREEVERARIAPAPPRAPKLSIAGGVPRAPCPLAEDRFQSVMITLSGVEFANLKGVSAEAMRSSYEAFLGQPRPIAIVCEIRDAAAAILERAGYLAAVRVPAQTIDAGVVRLDIVMAKVIALRVRGDAGSAESRIASYLGPLKEAEAFNARAAERYLLLAGDLPGYDVRLALKPADTGVPGEVIGELTVVRNPIDIDFNIQNFGSKQVGRFGELLRGQIYGLTGMGDRTTIGLFSTSDFREQQVIQLGHDMRLGREGLTIGAKFTYAWTNPGIPRLDVDAKTLVSGAELTYPVLRSQTGNFRAAVGLEYIDQDIYIDRDISLTGAAFSRDHLRVAYLRIDGDSSDPKSLSGLPGYSLAAPRWRVGGSLEVRQGLAILNASPDCAAKPSRCAALPTSRSQGDPTAAVIRVSGYVETRPIPDIAFTLAPRAQYSRSPLLSFEEFSAGSYTIGRGYDPGTITGDSGVGLQFEMKVGSGLPRSLTDFAAEPYLFIDQVWVWNRDAEFAGRGPQHVTSFGGGVRMAYGDRGRLDVNVSIPVKRDALAPDKSPTRVLLSYTSRLWPMGGR